METEQMTLVETVRDAIKARWGEPDNRHDDHYTGDAIAAIAAVRRWDVEQGPTLREGMAARKIMFDATGGNLAAMDAAMFDVLKAAAEVRQSDPAANEPKTDGDPMFAGLLQHLVDEQDAAAEVRAGGEQ